MNTRNIFLHISSNGSATHKSLILNCVCSHTRLLWCATLRPNGNVFHEHPLLWMCESGWVADKLQHPAKCQTHGGHKWLCSHCCDTLGTLLLCPATQDPPRRQSVGKMLVILDWFSGVWTDERPLTEDSSGIIRFAVFEFWEHTAACSAFRSNLSLFSRGMTRETWN